MGKKAKTKDQSFAKPATQIAVQSDSFFSKLNPEAFSVKIFVFLFAFLLYAQTISYDYTLDDPISTTQNKFVQQGVKGIPVLITKGYMYGVANLNHGAYRPLPLVTFALEHAFFGDNPQISHFINVLWFAITCLLLYVLLLKLFKSIHHWLAFVVVLLYCAHPIHTEVVASIKSRDEIMALFFIVIAGLLYLRFESKPLLAMILSFFFFFLAMLSKENALTFIVAFPMLFYFFKNYSIKQALVCAVPVFLAGVIYIFLRSALLERIAGDTSMMDPINSVLYATDSTMERYATALYILLQYVFLNIFPHPLSWDYSYNEIPIIGFGDPKAIFAVMVLGVLVYLGIRSIKKRSVFGFCILFFFTTISIVSNLIVDVGATLGERFLFIPSLAFCIAVGYLLVTKLPAKGTGVVSGNAKVLLAFILVFFVGKTVSRNTVWENNRILFTSGIETSPNSARVNFCLGHDYFSRALTEEDKTIAYPDIRQGIVHMQDAVRIFPRYVDAYKNIGFAYYELKEYQNALLYFKTVLSMNAKSEEALFYAGLSYGFLKNADSAFYFLDKCVEVKPDHERINYFKGLILSDVADVTADTAKRNQMLRNSANYFEKAVVEDPKDWEVFIQRGYCYGKLNDFSKAIPSLIKGTKLKKDNAQALLFIGIGYGLKQMPDSAVYYLNEARKIEPKNLEVYRNLAITYRNKQEFDKAIEMLNEGLKFDPTNQLFLALLNETIQMKTVKP